MVSTSCKSDLVNQTSDYNFDNIDNNFTISKIDEMANYLLNGTFKPEDAVDYGCSGRGFYDPFSATLGKHIDEADTAFYVWKKCIQCVLGHTE